MREWLHRHRFVVTATLLLVVPLFLMYLHGRRGGQATFLERVAVTLAGVTQSGLGSLGSGVSSVLSEYVLLVDLGRENERLKADNQRLTGEAILGKRLAVENLELRRLLAMKQAWNEPGMMVATVIGRELTPFYRVNRLVVEGAESGTLASDMAVITPLGLLGRVVQAAGPYGEVMLLADARSRVAAEVMGRGILGMVVGTGRPDDGTLRFQIASNEPPIESGVVVVTSGHDRVFPRGIEIGYVSDPGKRRQAGAYVEYELVPAVSPSGAGHVFVVGNVSAGPPRREGR
jgi:rod shape-determining protein MreC